MKSFSYSGSVKPIQVIFTSSQTYSMPNGYTSMDVFLVGGGGGGEIGYSTASSTGSNGRWISGRGGSGGYTTTTKNINAPKTTRSVVVSIGTGGLGAKKTESGATTQQSGGNTTITYNSNTYTAIGGGNIVDIKTGGSGGGAGSYFSYSTSADAYYGGNGGSNGGNGGNGSKNTTGAKGQGKTTIAFEESTGTKYGAGGGGGAYPRTYTSYATGGDYGGGNGGAGADIGGTQTNATSAVANTGSGGGGGQANSQPYRNEFYYGNSAGDGASGVAIIRLYPNNKRPSIVWNNTNTINM